MFPKLVIGGFLLLIGVHLHGVYSRPLSVSDLTYSKTLSLTKFHSLVDKYIPHDDLKEKAYLLRYLTPKNFNLKKAKNSLQKNLIWRATENIDSILTEDWSDFDKLFPYDLPTITRVATSSSGWKSGPALYIPYGSWNISAVVQAGSQDQEYHSQFMRYASAKMLEDTDRNARAQTGHKPKKDTAQFDIVVNLEGYSLEEQGCHGCVQILGEIIHKSEAHYSGAVDNLIFINAPPAFDYVYPWIAAAFHDKSQVTMTVQKEQVEISSSHQGGNIDRIIAQGNLVTGLFKLR